MDLWGAVESLQPLEFLASRRLRMKSKENAWTCNVPTSGFKGLHEFLASVFLQLVKEIKWPKITGGQVPNLWHVIDAERTIGQAENRHRFSNLKRQFDKDFHKARHIR